MHLQPGERNDSVFVEISHEKLDEEIAKYHALSWQWGSEKASEVIRIKHKDEDNTDPDIWTMEIMPNLLAALKHLRMKDKILRLWVDAICIEQIEQDDSLHDEEKNLEKSNQISIMTDIYEMAENVCVWLGEESEDSAKAIELVNRLVQLKDFDNIAGLESKISDHSNGNDLEALINLLKRGWFSRRWVVQVIYTVSRALALSLTQDRRLHWPKMPQYTAVAERSVGPKLRMLLHYSKRLDEVEPSTEFSRNCPKQTMFQSISAIFRQCLHTAWFRTRPAYFAERASPKPGVTLSKNWSHFWLLLMLPASTIPYTQYSGSPPTSSQCMCRNPNQRSPMGNQSKVLRNQVKVLQN